MEDFFRDPNHIGLAYLVAIALFIIGLKYLGSPRTARRGNTVAGVGMLIGLSATLLDHQIVSYWMIAIGVAIGTIIGVWSARAVKMTDMPQMVALFNGLGGGCVALIALAEYHEIVDFVGLTLIKLEGATAHGAILIGDSGTSYISYPVSLGIVAGAIIGTISFSGSLIAFAKLQGIVTGRPITFPGQTLFNGLLLIVAVGLGVWVMAGADEFMIMVAMVTIAFALGMLFVLPIGGADMPVIISLLNSFTGIAAAMAGFALSNNLLIVAGTIVGASGFLLTKLMGEAMNRPIQNVLFAGVGTGDSGGPVAAGDPNATVRSATVDDVAIMLAYARRVVIVPGYGLAVAQAQHSVRELMELLESRGVSVTFGIHPVAGRMPGHMNVLLAESNVPYEALREMEDINPEFKQTDVTLVIGANDVVNPAAKTMADSPLYGMPVLNVEESEAVVVLKRSMSAGYAGVDNPLFVDPKTSMLFGDAHDSVTGLVSAVKDA